MPRPSSDVSHATVGLCSRCRHARRTGNERGSVFWQCLRAREDPRFPRYPRLPVHVCTGYEPADDPQHESEKDPKP
jgi:hypothetical protein